LREGFGSTSLGKAEQRGVELSELVTEVLKRDIEINEALK
jgi:hypothetical protein